MLEYEKGTVRYKEAHSLDFLLVFSSILSIINSSLSKQRIELGYAPSPALLLRPSTSSLGPVNPHWLVRLIDLYEVEWMYWQNHEVFLSQSPAEHCESLTI